MTTPQPDPKAPASELQRRVAELRQTAIDAIGDWEEDCAREPDERHDLSPVECEVNAFALRQVLDERLKAMETKGLPLTEEEEEGMKRWLDPAYCPNQHRVDISRDLMRRLVRVINGADAEAEESHAIGKAEGYESAVQDIDLLTGGDGEYRFCTDGDPDRHTPDAATMKQRIAERVQSAEAINLSLRADNERMRGALEPFSQAAARIDPDAKDEWDWGTFSRSFTVGEIRNAAAAYALSPSPDLVGLGEGNQEDMAARDQSHTATAAPVASDVADQQHPGAEQ